MDLTNKFAQLKEYVASEYKLLIAQAAQEISVIRGGIESVAIEIGEDAQAIIETKIGTISINGVLISETPQYEAIVNALHKALGEQPLQGSAQPPAAPTITATETETKTVTVAPTPEAQAATVTPPPNTPSGEVPPTNKAV